jgi:hypothetical protein
LRKKIKSERKIKGLCATEKVMRKDKKKMINSFKICQKNGEIRLITQDLVNKKVWMIK